MARVYPSFPISGTVGEYNYFRRGDKTFVRAKRIYKKKKGKYAQRRQRRVQENCISFGGASITAAHAYTLLTKGQRGRVLPYSHNRIAEKLRVGAERTQRHVEHYSFKAARATLLDLDLSKDESPSPHLQVTAIGPTHSPHTIRVQGLVEAARAAQPRGQAHLEARFQLRYVEFREFKWSAQDNVWEPTRCQTPIYHETPPSGWIPTDILPDSLDFDVADPEAIHASFHPREDPSQRPPLLVFLMIEWREVRAVGNRPIRCPQLTVARLGAMLYTQAMATEIADFEATRPPSQQPQPHVNLLKEALENPKAFLAKALGSLSKNRPPG